MRCRDILLVIETSKNYGRGLLRGIGKFAFSKGNWSIYLEERGLYEQPASWVKDWRGDGIIVRSNSRRMVRTLLRTGCPIVETDPMVADFGLPFVYTDDRAATELAVEHFLRRGFRNLFYCSLRRTRWSAWRWEAFLHHCTTRDISAGVFQLPVCLERHDWLKQRGRLVQWLQTIPKPAAILAENDMCGNRLLDACRSVGLAVPEQIAVLGVDNDAVLCDLATPPLSSVDLNVERIGYEAAALLDRLMKNRGAVRRKTVRIQPRGVVARLSTEILAIEDAELVQALRYIRDRACEGIQVRDVSEHIAVSQRHMERKFRKELGRSPKEEITRVRIEHAKRLLSQTELPVSRIAQYTGFQTINYFANVFRRETTQSATEYRKRFR